MVGQSVFFSTEKRALLTVIHCKKKTTIGHVNLGVFALKFPSRNVCKVDTV